MLDKQRMFKKITKLIIAIAISCSLIVACTENSSDEHKHDMDTTVDNPVNAVTGEVTTNDSSVDFKDILGKTWVVSDSKEHVISFSFGEIVGNTLYGEIGVNTLAIPSSYDISNLTGEITENNAICKFSDSSGNEGTLELELQSRNLIEATVSFSIKSDYVESVEGNFSFRPFNLYDLSEFDILDEYTKKVNIDCYGDVHFVPVSFSNETHEPQIGMYLADSNDEVLFRFFPDLPRGVDFTDVACEDVNNDGLKDFVVIYEGKDYKDELLFFATIFIQRVDGIFVNDIKIDKAVNELSDVDDVDVVIEYLKTK